MTRKISREGKVKPTKTWHEMEKEWLSDPEFIKSKKAEEEFRTFDMILSARNKAGLTQEEVAKRMGTTQSAVARLESGLAKGKWPSMNSLQRYAKALGKKLEFRFI